MDVEKAIRTPPHAQGVLPRPVDAAMLDGLFELARWAPNHNLTNPWRFHVLGARARERLMELAESEKPGSAVKLAARTHARRRHRAAGRRPRQDREDELATGVAAYWSCSAPRSRPRRLLAHGRAAGRPARPRDPRPIARRRRRSGCSTSGIPCRSSGSRARAAAGARQLPGDELAGACRRALVSHWVSLRPVPSRRARRE